MEEINENRDKATKRIKALLSKTTENGASVEEAASAMSKANELMIQYFITLKDISDLDAIDNIVCERTDAIKIKYAYARYLKFYSAKLFDCKSSSNKYYVWFYGYSNDVRMAIYIYNKLVGILKNSIKEYKKSKDYKALTMIGYHGNSIISSYVEGFVIAVADKITAIHSERNRNFNDSQTGLMCLKTKKVEEFFNKEDIKKAKPINDKKSFVSHAYRMGESDGENTRLNDDLDTAEANSLLRLN